MSEGEHGEADTDQGPSGLDPEEVPKTKALYDWRGLVNATLIIAGVILGALAIWKLSSILLLVLCAAMLAIVLDASARAMTEPIGAPRWIGLAVSVLLTAGAAVAAAVFAGPTLTEQLAGVVNQADEGLQEVGRYLGSFDELPSELPAEEGTAFSLPDMLPAPGGILSSATAAISSVFGLLGSVLVVSVVGIYFAVSPEAYVEGFVRFAPRGQRRKLRRLVSRTGSVLRRWLIGKGISMLIVGVMSYAGLIILGVPLALFLAVFAGLAAFVPFLGPVVGGLAMGLVALSESWQLALWVLGLYLIIQTVESYLLTPLVQERTVYLLPAVVLVAQLVMGTLFGILGVALATPLTAIAMTVLEETYFNKGPAGSG
ncbi:AI-2E family transporter [Amorphus orientalis]|uniref:PurR-regulated permease PerM n=1 Tax=Amorphus orientalis TaxID=649198 RepID=A0AAE4AQ74_9HYPH|nr:AI-2E family transporter [Amorphus orientalis]MDQ0313706.1 putative PurR-regulated permease PerM [Amorphus orientalis]